ncbi:MAG: CoA transferase [Dehalococcoidia bacterium]|nr:CoA transferase [Dehalococcoidia bacterium]
MTAAIPAGPLAGVRVLDLTTARGQLAGRLLADLGADVLLIEPPGGLEARRWPPFDQRNGASLYWAAVALGKRSVVLDFHSPEDLAGVRRLAAEADVLFESSAPGTLARFGLDAPTLCAHNPALVYVSITPYGQQGPLSAWPASDLTLEAAGGLLSLQGDGDRPPLPVGYPQASFHAAAQAAADAVVALNERAHSGRGQHLDVSVQAAVVWALMNATGYPPNTGGDPPGFCAQRLAGRPPVVPGARFPAVWRCADGWATASFELGTMGAYSLDRLARWMEREDAMPAALAGRSWLTWVTDVQEARLAVADLICLIEALEAFFRTRTKRQILDVALTEAVLAAPFYSMADLAGDPQLAARDYWTTVGGRLHPGPSVRLSRTPIILSQPAPALDQDEPAWLRPRLPLPSPITEARAQPFAGLKVADFSWVGVGPMLGKALADHGATVVRVETATRPDILRLLPPFKDNLPGLDRSQFLANFNTSKYGLALDLTSPAAREIALRLVDWADVVLESFTPGTLARLGVDYAAIGERRPDVILLSTCLRGQTGPERTYGGFGGQGAALASFSSITGWPDRPPAGPWGAYTDFIAPRYGVAALAAALLERRRTGRGQTLDLAQVEAAIHFLEPLVLDYTVNGVVAGPAGHASPTACPNGVYRTAGEERYLALTVETPEQWRGLCSVAPLDAFALPAFDDLLVRREHLVRVDAALAAWLASQDAWEAAASLASAGVPASPVLRPTDLYCDAQLAARGFFVTLRHSAMGPTPYDGPATIFSETPARLWKAAPCLGEDTFYVLERILGFTADEIAGFAAVGALS